jgi:hypothetical protein
MHDLVIRIDTEGNVTLIKHPSQAVDTSIFGTQTARARGGYVYPQRKALRVAFKVLRRVFGSSGRVANFTRGWRCTWYVEDARTGKALDGTYTTHAQAVEAEIAYIMKELLQ